MEKPFDIFIHVYAVLSKIEYIYHIIIKYIKVDDISPNTYIYILYIITFVTNGNLF